MGGSDEAVGWLAVVATPIGCLEDISERALEALRSAECILCEDTRHTAKLLQRYGIATPTTGLREHNEASRSEQLVERLVKGARFALVSDAGTPLISDPGRRLIAAAHAAGVRVTPMPGACAVAAALSVAGFDADKFVFAGFAPSRATARLKYFESLKDERRTLVFYEAPHRIRESVGDMAQVFGDERSACLVKEMSKTHENVVRGSLADVSAWLRESEARRLGEFVVVVEGAVEKAVKESVDADEIMSVLCDNLSPSQAATVAAKLLGGKRNEIYRTLVKDKPPK